MKTKLLLFYLFVVSFLNAQERYNILWLSCEDIDPTLSCYGVKGIETPNIDRLAKEGIRYTNAYSTVGVCAPSRSSIITGMYPVSIGTHNMRTSHQVTYKGIDGDKYPSFQAVTDKKGRNIPTYSAVIPAEVKCYTEFLRADGYYCTNNAKNDYQFYPPFTAWDENNNKAEYRNAPKGMPFFSTYNYVVSHESRIWMKANDPMLVDPNKIDIPDYYPDIDVVRKDVGRKYSNIVELDKQIGEKIKQLEDDGLLDKTIIVFWSDHGGPLLRQKRAVGNTGLHVPLIIRMPKQEMAGTVCNDLVSLMDLAPTMLSLAGIKPPEYMQGNAFLGEYKAKPREAVYGSADRFDEVYDFSRSVIDGKFSYIRNFLPNTPLIYRIKYREQIDMTRELIKMDQQGELTGGAAYIFRDQREVEELYDLDNDQDEVYNLANDPKYRSQLVKMRKMLANWQLEIGDKGFIDEYDLVQMFWPGIVQPSTERVQVKETSKGLVLSCPTEGASIGYQVDEQIGGNHWMLYSAPVKLKKDQTFIARALRIGYQVSEPVSYSKE
ncbi:MAG: sulfatase [Carboxylicivirga sp.]|jgi:arylsulfatase A-like enzyme|nr:sulfatase [Carboxylicivirga sp.]